MEYKFSNKIAELKPSAIREIFKSLTDPSIISFAAGNPSPESFPVKELALLSEEIFANESTTALQYSITEGYTPLREAIAARQKKRFGETMVRDNDSVIVVSGGQQGIELACKILCNEGDAVICENPSFIGSLNSFRSNGATPVGVPMEDDGISLEGLEEALKNTPNAKMLYLIPTFHNPTGITMSLEKRLGVLKLAKKYGIVILEDNPYGELRFAGEDIPTLKSLDEDGIVIYAGTFSKLISSGLRVGFAIAPKEVISKMTVCKQVSDVHTTIYSQLVVDEFMNKYDFEGHINEIRDIYRKKSGLMMGLLDELCSDKLTYIKPEGGLFIWCKLPDGVDMPSFCTTAVENNVAVVPGNAFLVNESDPCSNFRINFSTPTDEQIVKGMNILADVLKTI